MKKKIIIIGIILVVIILITIVNRKNTFTINSQNIKWELVIEDNFDGDKINTSVWKVWDWNNTMKDGSSQGNSLHYFAPDDIFLRNGKLIISHQKRDYNKKEYTTGKITLNTATTYGKYKIRAKLPKGKGLWPAFWLSGMDSWPPEIDVFELLGHDPNTIYMSNHWRNLKGKHNFNTVNYFGPDFSADFHIFTLEWTPDSIVWYIDGIERAKTIKHIPRDTMIAIISGGIGGDWPGNPDENTEFPQYFEIDYFQYYKINTD